MPLLAFSIWHDYSNFMIKNEKMPSPKELEKEIGDFLSKKFGGSVKIMSPAVLQPDDISEKGRELKKNKEINFDLMPEELISYLNNYIIKQDNAKAVLATKICTHFNKIQFLKSSASELSEIAGNIKNNVLMIGPTGVGKTFMIKLIAKKIGVPFIKADATKFSETGYVGGDVEDLVRDLVREAGDDIELAQHGIIYVDEVDKIAASRNLIGADISRTGVQRALLKPMEETEVDLKVPHDPISMIQEIEMFRKTGERKKRVVNTKNILFIMSGAFGDLTDIIKKRTINQKIGFGAQITDSDKDSDILINVKSEDLVKFGFESEFVGRLPVKAVFERLTEKDLYQILKSPNNPIILSKKFDFSAYGIDIKFEHQALALLAKNAFEENTGARGLVSAIENALILFEKKLPSTNIKNFPVTSFVIKNPEKSIEALLSRDENKINSGFDEIAQCEKKNIKKYLFSNKENLSVKYIKFLTDKRIDIVAAYYTKHVVEVETALKRIKTYCDELKEIELYFYKTHDINIVLEEDAVDYILDQFVELNVQAKDFYKKLTNDFEMGLKLIRDKTGQNRFFITKDAIIDTESYLNKLVKNGLTKTAEKQKNGII